MVEAYRPNMLRRLFNSLVASMIRLGIGPSGHYLLTVRGRETGRSYSTPVHVVDWQGDRWLVAPYGTVDWVKNARKSGEISLSRRGECRDYVLREVEPEHRAPILQRYLEITSFFGPNLGVALDARVETFEEIAEDHPVFFLVQSIDQVGGQPSGLKGTAGTGRESSPARKA